MGPGIAIQNITVQAIAFELQAQQVEQQYGLVLQQSSECRLQFFIGRMLVEDENSRSI